MPCRSGRGPAAPAHWHEVSSKFECKVLYRGLSPSHLWQETVRGWLVAKSAHNKILTTWRWLVTPVTHSLPYWEGRTCPTCLIRQSPHIFAQLKYSIEYAFGCKSAAHRLLSGRLEPFILSPVHPSATSVLLPLIYWIHSHCSCPFTILALVPSFNYPKKSHRSTHPTALLTRITQQVLYIDVDSTTQIIDVTVGFMTLFSNWDNGFNK